MRAAGQGGVGVCHCPTSNGVLASGFCRTRELEAAGAPLGLGVDGSASNDGSNLMEELRHALLVNRLRYESAAAVTARDVIRWATQGSARCLGRSDIGTIAPGMQADLALYRLDELRFSGAHDPVAALVLCGAHRADRVMVAGRWRVVDGAIPGLDLAALPRPWRGLAPLRLKPFAISTHLRPFLATPIRPRSADRRTPDMKIAPLAALALALTASGCMTLEERRALDMEQCRGYGFRQGTDAFAQCMQTIDVERAAARRTYVYRISAASMAAMASATAIAAGKA